MRKLYVFPAFLLGFALLQSCSKKSASDAVAPINPYIVNVTIAPNVSYQLSLDNSGSVGISKQASHFQVSQTGVDGKSGQLIYQYIPSKDYQGTDEVILSNTKTTVVTGSECSNHSANAATTTTSTSYTTVKINVAN